MMNQKHAKLNPGLQASGVECRLLLLLLSLIDSGVYSVNER